jgi:hypothetical protein
MTNLVITGLFHDTGRKRSLVTVQWENDQEKRLGLVVPFGCKLDELRAETERAVKGLAKEIESATVVV